MAKAVLPTNFQDDILNASMDGKRRYNQVQNTDGTISLEDASVYDQVGSNFGAGQINATNKAVNESVDKAKIIKKSDDIAAVTQPGYVPDALVTKELINSLTAGAEHFYYDMQDGVRGFNTSAARGADTFHPFKSNAEFKLVYSSGNILGTALSYTYTVPKGITELIAYFTTKSGAASPVYAVFPDNYYARNNLHANFGADIIFYHVKEGDVMSFSIAANTNQWRYLDVYVA